MKSIYIAVLVQSHGGFAEGVDFAYWWSCIGKGLPCSLRSRLVYIDIVGIRLNRPRGQISENLVGLVVLVWSNQKSERKITFFLWWSVCVYGWDS